jgi:hypothetical protein
MKTKVFFKKGWITGCRKGVHHLYCGADCKKQKKTVLVDWLEKRHGSDVNILGDE